MPTKREREYYRMGFEDGYNSATEQPKRRHYERRGFVDRSRDPEYIEEFVRTARGLPEYGPQGGRLTYTDITKKPKRKLSAWNKFVKANSKKPRFRYRNGKLNLKKMAVAFRKSKR